MTENTIIKYNKGDKYDVVRGWGWHLLSLNDTIFYDKSYIESILNCQSDNAIVGTEQQNESVSIKNFTEIWKKLAPSNVEVPKTFYLTGSDANNSLYDLALQITQKKYPNEKIINGEILCMDKIWGGGRGKISGMGFLKDNPNLNDFRIPCPYTEYWNDKSDDMCNKIKSIEMKAFEKIKKCVSIYKNIGGLLIEPIIGPYGVYFFRHSFMKKLRQLCDDLHIPIIADEILTGGGRTGKFFSYEHYPDFEPDYITFGKGLMISGLTRVFRKNYEEYPLPDLVAFGPTLYHYNDCIIKSTIVLNKIYNDNLMQNAEKMGKYFMKKLRLYAHDKLGKKNIVRNIRGIGLLIYVKDNYCPENINTGMGRLMPELTITEETINEFFDDDKCFCDDCL
jgi:4-aminobutyrate aminotransferase-like enzyme